MTTFLTEIRINLKTNLIVLFDFTSSFAEKQIQMLENWQ